jgi:retinoblastoma-like protein 1
MAHSYVFLVCLNSVKQNEKGMDLIASLCHNYHASEECVKEMMDKSHKAIEDIFGTKALSASEGKTENLDKIDTGMGPFLTCLCMQT